jgi:16S rRNA (guanine527-N7)-methyltransferase
MNTVITEKQNNYLQAGLSLLGITLSSEQFNQLVLYLSLLIKWNKFFNLTAIRDTNLIISHHLLDGLSVIPYIINSYNILDVGSGMGVPGIILAICYPNKVIYLLDSNNKKTTFLQQSIIELKLSNVKIINQKIEEYYSDLHYDVAISRAFSDCKTFIHKLQHLDIDTIMLMKGKNIVNEVQNLDNYSYILNKLTVPYIKHERYLLTAILKQPVKT